MSSAEEPHQHTPDPKPKEKTDTTNANNVPKGKGFRTAFRIFFGPRKSNLRAVVLFGIGGFFITWGSFYYNNRHAPPWIAVLLIFVGGVFESFAAKQFVINFGRSNRASTCCCVVVVVATSLLSGFNLYLEYRTTPGPHLVLCLAIEGASDEWLQFTNSFLFAKQNENRFTFPTNLPLLIVEVASTNSHAVLNFGLLNDPGSPTERGDNLDVERPQITLLLTNADPKVALRWRADPKWERVSILKDFQGQTLGYRFPRSLPLRTAEEAPRIIFDMQEKPGDVEVFAIIKGRGISPIMHCFKLAVIPSNEAITKLRFETNDFNWSWKYRPVAYRPIDASLTVSPTRVQLSDGTNTFGTTVTIYNPNASNLYAITASVDVEQGSVPISSLTIELSKAKDREVSQTGELTVPFEASVDFIGSWQSRLFVIPVLQSGEHRTFWIRGTILTNSFADISIWQTMSSFPNVKYRSDGTWSWPVLSHESAWWAHTGMQPMDWAIGVHVYSGTNGVTNGTTTPSHP